MTYATSLLLDVSVIVLCVFALLRFARPTHSHPATIYLVFHVYTFTWRLVGLATGGSTLFSDFAAFAAVREGEITRAALLGDVVLLVMTGTWLYAAHRQARSPRLPPERPLMLRDRLLWTVVAIAMPLGLYGYASFAVIPSAGGSPGVTAVPFGVSDAWRESSYLQILEAWPGLLILALIYRYGFKPWLFTAMLVHLAIMAVQGYHRYRVLIPVLMLAQVYVDRSGRRWPPLRASIALAVAAMLFFPLKTIGRMVQEHDSLSDIADTSAEVISNASGGRAADQQFLDQFASTLSLVDENGTFYLGKPYLALATLPIPRQWWAEKPSLAEYIEDFSRPWRPMAEMGMVVTFLGEAYANFGYIGILLIPMLLAYWLARIYYAAYARPYGSVFHFAYILLACNMLQIFRDGLISVEVFLAVNMMPLALIVLFHGALIKLSPDRSGAIA